MATHIREGSIYEAINRIKHHPDSPFRKDDTITLSNGVKFKKQKGFFGSINNFLVGITGTTWNGGRRHPNDGE